MSKFVKPKVEYAADKQYIETLINTALRKDLHDNEEICMHCRGTGLIISNNRYGLSNDPDKKVGSFPYVHQAFSFCPHCFNGIVHRCELCGEIMPRGRLKHDCEQQKIIDRQKELEKERKLFAKAIKLTPKAYEDQYPGYMVYHNDRYYYDVEDLIENLWGRCEREDLPTYCFGTTKDSMCLDADYILTSAEENVDCEDLSFSSKGREELKAFLKDWNEKYSEYYYYPNENVVIIIPEDLLEEQRSD